MCKMYARCMMSKFSHFAVKKFYFKLSFNNINENRGPLFLQINFDQTYFRGWHGFFFVQMVFVRGGYVPEPLPFA